MASNSSGKEYYCKVSAEFGRVMPDGTLKVKNPSGSTWLDLDYGEAVTFQTLVLRPMVSELRDDSLELGILKAVDDGTMDKEMGDKLLVIIGKQAPKTKTSR